MTADWWTADPVVAGTGAPPAASASGDAGNWWAQDALAPQQMAASSRGNAEPPARQGGLLRNLAAGANEAVTSALGAPVDAAAWLINRIASPFTGTAGEEFGPETRLSVPPSMANVPQPPPPHPMVQNPVGGSDWLKAAFGLLGADPRNVGVNTVPEAVARNVGAAAADMVAPYLGARALIARGIGVPAPSGAPLSLGGATVQMLGGPAGPDAGLLRTGLGAAGNAAVGTGASLGGQGAEALLPENSPYRPLANVAGQMLGGGLVAGGMGLGKAAINTGVDQAREMLGLMLPSRAEGIAANRLAAAASDPAAVARALSEDRPELVPGSRPTTYQVTGDQGLGRLQAELPQGPFEARTAEQNTARVAGLSNVAAGNPGAVRDLLQQRLAGIDAAGDRADAAARQKAQQALEQAGGNLNREDYGAAMRDQLEAAKAETKRQEGRLWDAIDPGGTLTIDGMPVRERAREIVGDIPDTAAPPGSEEAAIYRATQLLGTATPFRNFAALRSRLLEAIRQERASNGQSQALRRMQQLRSAMDDAISSMSAKAAQGDPGLFGRIGQEQGTFYGPGASEGSTTALGGYPGASSTHDAGLRSQAVYGVPGTAGAASRRFGNDSGSAGVPPPPRPQDIVQFLAARGGLLDQGGELRARDLNRPNKGISGILSRSTGMPLDTAREIAAEEGFLHPDSDVNDLLDAIDRTLHGLPVFSDRDATAAADWLAYENARRKGALEPEEMPPLPGAPANWDAAAAARYRAAADASRTRAQTFNNPIIGPALQERGGVYRIAESRLPERFLGTPEGVQAFLAGGGDRRTLVDALIGDLKQSALDPDGTLNPRKFASWQAKRGAAIRALPEVGPMLNTVADAQVALDRTMAASRAARLDFQRGAARHFLNAEPMQAVQSVLAGKNPVGDMKALAGMVAGDPEAAAGLQRAVVEWIAQRAVRAPAGDADVGTMSAKALGDLLAKHEPALAQVFSPDQMTALRNILADLQRAGRPLPAGEAAGGRSLLRGMFGHGVAGLAGLIGYLHGGAGHGALSALAVEAGKKAVEALTRAGIERRDQLLTEALLHPELARTLLMKATPANRPFIAQRLRSQLGTLALAGAAPSTQKR